MMHGIATITGSSFSSSSDKEINVALHKYTSSRKRYSLADIFSIRSQLFPA